jgi:hypothetical protein
MIALPGHKSLISYRPPLDTMPEARGCSAVSALGNARVGNDCGNMDHGNMLRAYDQSNLDAPSYEICLFIVAVDLTPSMLLD